MSQDQPRRLPPKYAALTSSVAIVSLTALEITALVLGKDGQLLLPVAGLVAGLGGYTARDLVNRVRGRGN